MSEELNKNNKTPYNEIEQTKDNSKAVPDNIPEEKQRNTQIISNPPKVRKKGLTERLVRGVIGPTDGLSVGEYVRTEIIVPAFKNVIADSVTTAINIIMFGNDSPRGGYGGHISNGYGYRPKVNYNDQYDSRRGNYARSNVDRVGRSLERDFGGGHTNIGMVREDVEDYIIDNRRDAMDVLAKLQYDADIYGTVSIADYYDLIGVPTQWTHNTYGWDRHQLSSVAIRPVQGGFILILPPVQYLN